MFLNRYPIPDSLIGSVESIWTFGSPAGLPAGSLNMSVANGKAKLLISVGNPLTARRTGKPDQLIKANSLVVVGLTTQPVCLISHGPLQLISVEFTAGLAYRFLTISLSGLTDAIWSAEEAFGLSARRLEGQLIEQPNLPEQVNLLTDYLTRSLLHSTGLNPIVEYVVEVINKQNGLVNLSEVSRRSGYSHRYVDKQFLAHVGVTPKLFARLIRFQTTFRHLINQPALQQADLYQTYYDQPHYIHEFKHFTGYSPGIYRRQMNPFGELFYR